MLTMQSLRLANNDPFSAANLKLHFGPTDEFAIGTDAAGNFFVGQGPGPLSAPLLSVDNQNTLRFGAQRVEALALDAAGGIFVRGVKQWELVQSEDFSAQGAGWNRTDVSTCAGVHMLGGFCKFSLGAVHKTFVALPAHSQLRVVATYHFIDRWIGESGFMKLDVGQGNSPIVVWSEQHQQGESKNGVNVCGSESTPEGKFSASIDVTVPHAASGVTVTFGSTMEDADPCDESWGVSGVELYVRQ